LDVGEILLNTIPQRFVLSQRGFGGAVIAKMIPNKFIRVQIRRIAGKKMQFQHALKGLYISGNKPCFMSGQPVNDEKHGTSPVPHKRFQEFDKPSRIQPAGIDRIPKGPAGCDGGNGTDRLTLAAGLYNRRLSLGTPCAHLLFFFVGQLRCWAGMFSRPKSGLASDFRRTKPAVDAGAAQAVIFHDNTGRFAFLDAANSHNANYFRRSMIECSFLSKNLVFDALTTWQIRLG